MPLSLDFKHTQRNINIYVLSHFYPLCHCTSSRQIIHTSLISRLFTCQNICPPHMHATAVQPQLCRRGFLILGPVRADWYNMLPSKERFRMLAQSQSVLQPWIRAWHSTASWRALAGWSGPGLWRGTFSSAGRHGVSSWLMTSSAEGLKKVNI